MSPDQIKFLEDGVEAALPQELYLAIARLQGSDNLGWRDACTLAAQRIDSNTVLFEKSVRKEVLKKHRSELFTELNKGRATIINEAFENGKKAGYIWYFCDTCGEAMDVTPNSDAHKAIIGYMKEHGWGHKSCHR